MIEGASRPDVSARGPSSLRIVRVETEIVDIPIRRPHQFSKARIATQAYLLVQIHTEGGIIGLGEGVTPGGPWWSGDSVEAMKVMIDAYLAPAIVGQGAGNISLLHALMNKVAFGNPFAKAAIDVALWDVLGQALGVPVHELFGGCLRDRVELTWALASGDTAKDIAEAEDMMARRLSRVFKLKGGFRSPEDEVKHAAAIVRAFNGDVEIRIDINQAWDETTATRWVPRLVDAGVSLVEQPVQGWNIEGLARLRQRYDIRVMADESACTLQDAMGIARVAAVDVIACKLMKSGGLGPCRQMMAIAAAAGIPCYGGTFLDSSIGVAAGLQLMASEANASYGCEFIGGLWLRDEVVQSPCVYEDFHVVVHKRSGIGMTLDRDKTDHYRRR